MLRVGALRLRPANGVPPLAAFAVSAFSASSARNTSPRPPREIPTGAADVMSSGFTNRQRYAFCAYIPLDAPEPFRRAFERLVLLCETKAEDERRR